MPFPSDVSTIRRAYFTHAIALLGADAPPPPAGPKFCLDQSRHSSDVVASDTFNENGGSCEIVCAAVRAEALRVGSRNVSPPSLYDNVMLEALFDGPGTLADALDAEPHMLNSQNLSGVTLLMKSCRMVSPGSPCQSGVVKVLIERGADLMLCCDSGRNALHDLFWGTSAFPDGHEREHEPEDILAMFQAAYGRRKVLALMMAPDHHGNTPLEFTCKRRWQRVVDLVASSCPPPSAPVPLSVPCFGRTVSGAAAGLLPPQPSQSFPELCGEAHDAERGFASAGFCGTTTPPDLESDAAESASVSPRFQPKRYRCAAEGVGAFMATGEEPIAGLRFPLGCYGDINLLDRSPAMGPLYKKQRRGLDLGQGQVRTMAW